MNLTDAMRAHYSNSGWLLYRLALPITIAVYIAALITAAPLPNWAAGVLALLALVAQIAVFLIRVLAMDSNDVAEGIRRTAMLKDGLGVEPSPVQLAKLQERTAMQATNQQLQKDPYYNSPEPVSLRRLLDITAECAFFTSSLARRLWKIFGGIAIAGFLTPVIAILAVVLLGAGEPVLEIGAKAVLATVAFFAAGDIAMMAVQFYQLARDADRVLDHCEGALRGDGHNLDSEALTAFDEYNCAVGKAPPVPAWIYNRNRERLNAAWAQKQAARKPAAAPAAPAHVG
jgi:hypothetical protein